ncbi:MAG: alpha-glucosidase family protein [Elainellaceae cyanobacterium]
MHRENRVWWRTAVINRRAWQWEDANDALHDGEWWQNAIIYQITPWSFFDSSGNGKGDLNGILKKIDYIAGLGVDAIWLSPFFDSPMDDLGYDIVDMRSIDATFGSMADFKRLLAVAHTYRLRVIIDQVWNHTSDQHPWFKESRQSRDNPKADWYVWADPKPDGSPPNNWLSSFTGKSAWKWDPQREQFYFYNFLDSQPDLNWHNPAVVKAILERGKFWLDMGVDGLRIDAVNYFLHDDQMRDNPERPDDAPLPDGVPPDNPLTSQMLTNSFCRPETLEAIHPIRELVDQYPGAMTLGEVTLCEDTVELAGQYVKGRDRLHMAYHSALLEEVPMTATLMRDTLKRVVKHFRDGGACWIVGNHDYGRLRSRWTGKDENGNPYPDAFYHMMAALLLSLPGAFCLYQGDELGLAAAAIPEDIAEDEMKDPFGIALYPDVKGRDGSRTPMPWDSDQPNAGFTVAQHPWLPIPGHHVDRAVNRQHFDPRSLLNTWRRLLHWRKHQPAMEAGKLTFLEAHNTVLALERAYAEQHLLCLFNISNQPAEYDLSRHAECQGVEGLNFPSQREGDRLTLPPYGVYFGKLPDVDAADLDRIARP